MARSQGNPNSPLVCFCELVTRDPFFLVGRGDPSAFQLTDLPELRFATVSEVPTPWLCLQQDLRDAGVDPDRLERLTNLTMADNLEALRKGDLDVARLFEPYASMALTSGTGRILYTANSPGQPSIRPSSLPATASPAIVQRLPQWCARFAWLQEHSVDELAAGVAPFYPGLPSDLLLSSLRRYQQAGLWATHPEVSRKGFA